MPLPIVGYINPLVADALRDPTSGINTTQLRGDAMRGTDAQLFEDIEKHPDFPSFVREYDGWYVSTSMRGPWGPYPSLRGAVRAVVSDALDGAAP